VKLNALPDGAANLRQLFEHRFRRQTDATAPAPAPAPKTVIPGPRQAQAQQVQQVQHTTRVSNERTEQCETV
jgi:hypothetical protein